MDNPPLKKKRSSRLSAFFGTLLILFLLLAAPVGLFWGINRYNSAQSWLALECRMNDTVSRPGRRWGYYYVISYEYKVGDVWYKSNRYGLFANPDDGKKQFGEANPVGSIVPCYVNPNDPTDSVIVRDMAHIPWFFWIIPAIFVLLWLIAAAYVVIWVMNRRSGSGLKRYIEKG